MFDPANANQKSEPGFGGNDKSAQYTKDDRFLLAEHDKPGDWSLVGGDNYICVLPSASNVGEFIPSKPQDYKLGLPFLRVTVRPPGVKRMRNYKIQSKDNPLTKSYWRLYESIGKTPLWKEITAGFQAGGDNRRILQVVTIKGGGKVSPVKMWSVTDTRGGETKEGQKPTMYEMVKTALQQVYMFFKQPENGGQPVFPFMPATAAVLKVTVLFQGEIPQFTITPYFENGKPVLLNLSPQWDAADKDMGANWIAEPDELPDITTLETVMRSPQACQILGLATSVAPAAAAAPAAPPLATAPQFQQTAAPFVPQGAPATGFGVPQGLPQGAPAVSPITGTPAAAPVVGAAPVMNPAQGGAAAAAQFTAGLQEELAKRAQGSPTGSKSSDQPPF